MPVQFQSPLDTANFLLYLVGMTSNDHIQWCSNMFAMLNEGGTWAVPRSGLIFQKRNGEFVLDKQMPWQPDLPGTPEDWAAFQADDFSAIREHFGAAGVKVVAPEAYGMGLSDKKGK
jgi:hypothetical protein